MAKDLHYTLEASAYQNGEALLEPYRRPFVGFVWNSFGGGLLRQRNEVVAVGSHNQLAILLC